MHKRLFGELFDQLEVYVEKSLNRGNGKGVKNLLHFTVLLLERVYARRNLNQDYQLEV